MTRLVKGGKFHYMTGNDVIINEGDKHLGKTVNTAIEEVDKTLDEHQKEIDKLKSNVKYIYSYGAIGGSGSGGSGGGSQGTPKLFISLGGHPIQAGVDNVILLNGVGTYSIEMNVTNSNGDIYLVRVDTIERWDYSTDIPLNIDNRYRFKKDIYLDKNGTIKVEFYKLGDYGVETLDGITQSYIVTPHTFSVKFKYELDTGTGKPIISEFANNEYFIGDSSVKNPFIESSFKIDLPNVTNISLEYHIGDTDESEIEENNGQGIKNDFTLTSDTFKNMIDKLTRKGVKFTDESNTGTYVVKSTLRYTVNGNQQVDEKEIKITLIPGYLYINVRNPQDLLYDTLKDLHADEQDNVPRKNLPVGVYTPFYCKVYEGPMTTDAEHYIITYNSYDSTGENEFDDVPASTILQDADEQIETPKPISAVFDSPGIKKLTFSTVGKKGLGREEPTIKYIYIKEPDTNIDWYPALDQRSFYFRANSIDDTWSVDPQTGEKTFPDDWGKSALVMSNTSHPKTLLMDVWNTPGDQRKTTILTLGIQYSSVNKDHSEILSTYAKSGNVYSSIPNLTLYSDKFYDKSIFIPTESNFNVSSSEQFHLVQIVRHRIDQVESIGKYATYLYIDGKLESNSTQVDDNKQWYIGKIVLNNVNVIYNLINIQYIKMDIPGDVKGNVNVLTIDELIYQYYLAYKSKMYAGTVTESEKTLLQYLPNVKFNGEDVIVNDTFVSNISPYMPIPTMMFEYGGDESTSITDDDLKKFKEGLFKGYGDGDTNTFGEHQITLYWCDGLKNNIKNSFKKIKDPEITVDGLAYTGAWKMKLQGTSTMRNKIKNFSLYIDTKDVHGDRREILMSPNYNPNDTSTFLPENEWTIKADIADSAHANNTAVGRFVNRVCTPFIQSNGISVPNDVKGYIKNTLEGFPILMYVKIGQDIYYLGVYNFNMGRESYYNLGYVTGEGMTEMKTNIQTFDNSPFSVSLARSITISTLAIGEIQENNPEFDFHQYQESVLFQPVGETTDRSSMFGGDSDLKGTTARNTLRDFVKSVAFAGAYCFANIGKTPVSSKQDGESTDCINRYKAFEEQGIGGTRWREEVPDVSWQFNYVGKNKVWFNVAEGTDEIPGDINKTFNNIGTDVDNLLNCIYDKDISGEITHPYHLDFTSVSEYYTVCMAFGLVDSIIKNMNIKSWDAYRCYVAFYDMDCGFGEDNNGEETISYLAASDYWHSNVNNDGSVLRADIIHDYWPQTAEKGFDYTSSYLFAIAKYAQAILEPKGISLNNYPQELWARWRQPKNETNDSLSGQLCNADYFIEHYFASGIGQIPSYMASLNYQVKYLYKGIKKDKDQGEIITYLDNGGAFNGSRLEKVRDWLNRRLHFLDVVFNAPRIDIPICNGTYKIPKIGDNLFREISKNLDVTILSDAFSREGKNTGLLDNNGVSVDVYAPKNTPCIVCRGERQQDIYILGAGVGNANKLIINSTATQRSQVLGSREFTNLSMVDPLLTTASQISTNNLEEIIYGASEFRERSVDFAIYSTSVKKIILNIPTFSGQLSIDTLSDVLNGQALTELNVSNSGFYGSWTNLGNLKKLNISSVNNPEKSITVSGCPLLTGGDNCIISGSEESPTRLEKLTITGVSGVFNISNTQIQTINFSALPDTDSIFSIIGDTTLTTLSLTGFKKIIIKDCPNLNKLTITEHPGKNVCEEIIINTPPDYKNPDGSIPTGLEKLNSSTSGVFDFTSYINLKKLGLSGCKNVEVIKMPNHKVSVDTFNDNPNLEFIDTVGKNSIIELTRDATFLNCPKYAMRQSWWSRPNTDDGKNIIDLKDMSGSSNQTKYTKMCVSEECTSLERTFSRQSTTTSSYTSTPYTNSWGQKVFNGTITFNEVKLFLDSYVGGGKIDDAYIDEEGIIHDTLTTQKYIGEIINGNNPDYKYNTGDYDYRKNITSLAYCFYKQSKIIYTGNPVTLPDLSEYKVLDNIGSMYEQTGITYLSAELLNLYDGLNNIDDIEYVGPDENKPLHRKLSWYNFIGTGNIEISKDAFRHISYRINGLSAMILKIYNAGMTKKNMINTSESDGYLDILCILCPKKKNLEDTSEYAPGDDLNDYIPFKRITRFEGFNIDENQYIDYRNLFKLCPNVTSLSQFLVGNLSKSKIDGMLYPCTKLSTIYSSFNHTGDVSELAPVNLYQFFNWENEDLYDSIYQLFTTSDNINQAVGFSINKVIDIEDFKTLIGLLHNYKNITSLANIFSYCTINNYDGFEIDLGEDMNNIININAMFYMCNGKTSSEEHVPLKIRRSFFKHLPNVLTVSKTFYGVYFDHMLSYDFFCKRKPITKNVYVIPNGQDTPVSGAVLRTSGYRSQLITDMSDCFTYAKFKDCRPWFDIENDSIEDEDSSPIEDTVTYEGNTYDTYYEKKVGIIGWIEHSVQKPTEISDTFNNFTNYVDVVRCLRNERTSIDNHNIKNDLANYGIDPKILLPYNTNDFNIYPTYCCLPPDIFYGCDVKCKLTNVFADTNIIGVIPQHLLKNCYNCEMSNMFRNVNILPNLIYHYNSKTADNPGYLSLIRNIEEDNETIGNYVSDEDLYVYELAEGNSTVLFRNSSGQLRRRRPIISAHSRDKNKQLTESQITQAKDYSKSIFTYVPQGYTTNQNLKEAFTFRYNLPQNVDLYRTQLEEDGITWPSGSNFGNEYAPEYHPELWPYYIQYFFTVDESISWNVLTNMSHPFISDSQDVDFYTGNVRVFSATNTTVNNKWWTETVSTNIDKDSWSALTNGIFNSFLNLCGKRDVRTGKLTDCGCIISKSWMTLYPKLDSFVSGILVTLLNGRIFDDDIDAGRFATMHISSENIIQYTTSFAKNILFPVMNNLPPINSTKVLITFNSSNTYFYSYMFRNSLEKYKKVYNIQDNNILNKDSYDSTITRYSIID